jgi:hypothetical protein
MGMRREKTAIEMQMEGLRGPIREAMRNDPGMMHRAYSLEARIALAEIRGRRTEVEGLLIQYSELSTEAKRKVGGEEKR